MSGELNIGSGGLVLIRKVDWQVGGGGGGGIEVEKLSG